MGGIHPRFRSAVFCPPAKSLRQPREIRLKSGETMNPVCRTPLCARPETTVPSRFFCHRQHVPQTGNAAQKTPVANRLSFILPPLAARWRRLSAPEPRSKNNLSCAATRVYTRIKTPLCARPKSTIPSRFFCHRQHVPQTGKTAQKTPVANRLSFILPPLAARWMRLSAPEPRSKNNLPCAATRVYTRIKVAKIRGVCDTM